MIDITLHGTDTARCGDVEQVGGKSPISALARKLVAGGADPDAMVSITRDGTLCFDETLLSTWAGLTVTETDRQSVKHSKWVPMPDGLHGVAK